MKKFLIFCLLLTAATIWAQKTQPKPTPEPKRLNEQEVMEQTFNRLFEMQRKMAEQMMKRFAQPDAHDQDMDKLLQQFRQGMIGEDTAEVAGFTSRWEDQGKERHLIITPTDPNNKLDIDVNKDRVTLSGKVEEKVEHQGPNGKSYSTSVSSFSSSIGIPYELDADKVQMEGRGKDIVMKFPYRQGKAPVTKAPSVSPRPKKDSFLKPLDPGPEDISL